MPLALVKETGVGTNADANSYADLADAASYHETCIAGSAWSSLDDDEAKKRALIQAARTLDNLCAWPSVPALLKQPLDWPRTGVVIDGRVLGNATVPTRVVFATCELARILLTTGDPTQEPDDDGTVASETIGPLKTDYRAPAGFGDKAAQLDQALPRSVMALLRPLLANVGGVSGGTRFVSTLRV